MDSSSIRFSVFITIFGSQKSVRDFPRGALGTDMPMLSPLVLFKRHDIHINSKSYKPNLLGELVV